MKKNTKKASKKVTKATKKQAAKKPTPKKGKPKIEQPNTPISGVIEIRETLKNAVALALTSLIELWNDSLSMGLTADWTSCEEWINSGADPDELGSDEGTALHACGVLTGATRALGISPRELIAACELSMAPSSTMKDEIFPTVLSTGTLVVNDHDRHSAFHAYRVDSTGIHG